MDKYYKHQENTDGEETMFFRAPESGRPTDQYDTQQLNAGQVRRQAGQNGYAANGYEQNGYPQDGYGRNGYEQSGYSQNGYAQNGFGQNGYPQNGYPQGQRPRQSASGGYGQQSRPQQRNNSRSGSAPSSYAQRRPSSSGNRSQQQRQPAQSQRAQYYPPSGQRPPQQRNYGTPQRQSAPPRQSQPPKQPRQSAPAPAPRQSRVSRHRQKKSLLGRLVKLLLTLIVALFLIYSAIAMIGILGMNRVETGDRGVTSGSLDASYVKNVLVIGTDTRDPEQERGRSDSMILVSMNSKTHDIYMTSFMRDAYVDIPGNGSGKLNAAYSYGGPELLMDTLESNYDVHIDDYVMITFSACAEMIDAVGGVELTISDEEAQAVNEILISEVNEIMGDEREDDLLDGGGTLTLDGKQALSYSRIRYVGNADFERTERQRTVMQQVMEKVKGNPLRLASICMSALPEMTTNLSVGALYGYAVTTPLKLVTYDMQQQRIPADGTFSGADIGGESVLQVDFAAAHQQLEDTVFADK